MKMHKDIEAKGMKYLHFSRDTWRIEPNEARSDHNKEAMWLLIDFLEECKKHNVRP